MGKLKRIKLYKNKLGCSNGKRKVTVVYLKWIYVYTHIQNTLITLVNGEGIF